MCSLYPLCMKISFRMSRSTIFAANPPLIKQSTNSINASEEHITFKSASMLCDLSVVFKQ